MNHKLNNDQMEDLKNNWNIIAVDELNTNEKNIWGNIPPEMNKDELKTYLKPILFKIKNGDYEYIILAGELSACLILIEEIDKTIYADIITATTRRESIEMISPDGETIKKSVFKHVRFREL